MRYYVRRLAFSVSGVLGDDGVLGVSWRVIGERGVSSPTTNHLSPLTVVSDPGITAVSVLSGAFVTFLEQIPQSTSFRASTLEQKNPPQKPNCVCRQI